MTDTKVCANCGRAVPLETEECPGCGGKKFVDLILTPLWNSIEPYEKEEEKEI